MKTRSVDGDINDGAGSTHGKVPYGKEQMQAKKAWTNMILIRQK